MRMRGHRVPHTARLEHGHTHHELRAAHTIGVNVLRNPSSIRTLGRSNLVSRNIGGAHKRRWIIRVRWIADDVESRGLARPCTIERHVATPATNVHYVAYAKIERLSVDCNCSAAADVENPNFPPLCK